MARLIVCGFFALTVCAAATVDFNRDVRPILSDNCFTCHGPDEKHRMANVRLDTEDGLARVNEKIVARISPGAKPQLMPPPSSGRRLTPRQVETIRGWVAQGARWQRHWAYTPPVRPPVPAVKNAAWPKTDIDRFLLARLEREGLKPSPEADRVTLLRRLSLDLTGLPPTPAEVDAYLADRSPLAWEKQVDRLLASPHYGERMALQWLDLARYADTHGYHIDSHRDMWHWRDWVIGAFNRNLPFDRFTVMQLAGDLLPGATREDRLATGFNRNHMINFEGGAIPEEYQAEYVMDRVETTATVWMGTTMGCARCHDHKYDPIPQRDYYRMFAFFNTIGEKGLDGRAGNAEPAMALPQPSQEEALGRLRTAIEARQAALPEKAVGASLAEWEKTRIETFHPAPRKGLAAHYEFDGALGDSSGRYQAGRLLEGEVTYSAAPVDRAAAFGGEARVRLGDGAPIGSGPFTLAFWVRTSGVKAMPMLEKAGVFSFGFGDAHRAPELKRAAPIRIAIAGAEVRPAVELIQREWRHVALAWDGRSPRLWIDGKAVAAEVSGSPAPPASAAAPLEVAKLFKGELDDLRIYSRPLGEDEIDALAVREPARAALLVPAPRRSREQAERLRRYFLSREAPEPYRTAWRELEEFQAQRAALEKEIPTTMVMEEMKKPRETFVLGRGDYRNRGEKVAPAVPSMLPPLPAGEPANRLGLARWLVSPSHPLTARVAVNRYWQLYFGTGLVKTSEDFGMQGDAPVQRELLDWLATEFVRTGWDVKALQRLIAVSATYRQSSKVSPELLERDPENRLLARGPRFRLPAEMVRDNALAAGGLLNASIGGPSVFPYQPKGVWEELAYGDVYSAQEYEPSHGPDLYRRGMYTFWKRTAPPPSLGAFDAPDREKCAARRLLTNTPLQALALMNDPTYVEAARALAERAMRGARTPRERVRLAFRLAAARTPSARETAVLLDLHGKKLAGYRRDPDAARQLLSVGESKADARLAPAELAAWTTVASVILNLDETITKE